GVLHNFPLRMQSPSANAVPWLGIGLGIVYRDHVIDVVPIGALETFDGVQLIAVRVTDGIDARAPVEPDGIDNQRVAFPASDRVAKPGGIEVLRMRPSVN